MTLEGANLFFDTTDYAIYTMNSVNTGQYCVVLPKNNTGTYNMIVDLHMKNAFDSLSNGSKTKEQLIEEIKNEYTGVKSKYSDGILVIPMIDENLYASAVINNDKQKMFDKVKKIGAITSEIYKKLTDSGIDKQKIDQKIIMIIKNNDDIKFVDWLKEQMPNFVIGVNLSDLQVANQTNPFMENNNTNPFVAANPVPPVGNDIFGASPSTPVENSANNNIFATPVTNNTTASNDIFSTPTNNTVTEPTLVQEPVQQPVEVQSSAPTQPVVEPANVAQPAQVTPTVEPVATNPVPEQVVQSPTPVQSTPLEATTTIQPVQQTEATTTNEAATNIPAKKGSKGFTNLIILLVVLVGVTFISIELGKFLYNTYGV